MSQRESRLSREILTALRVAGAYAIKIHGSEFTTVGTPDIQGCYKGKFFALETKLPEKRSNTTPMQERQMQKVRLAGGVAQVVCTVQEALEVIKRL